MSDKLDQPLVSAVITTYNRRELVQEAIDSALAQTYEPMEVIVVDDGSTDGTKEMLRERYGEDDRVRTVELDGPSGSGAAKNSGAEEARGEFLAFLDSDDWWYPSKTEIQMRVMQEHGTEVGAVGSSCEYMDEEGEPTWEPTHPPDEARYEEFCVRLRMPGSGSNHLIRRSAFAEIDGFDESLTKAQDKDFWIRLLRRYEIQYAREITARIRFHEGERVNVNIKVIMECRRRIDRSIPEWRIRRKATAWSYFSFFRRLWDEEPIRAVGYLALSFLSYPFPLDDRTRRFRPALWRFKQSLTRPG